MIRLNNLSYHLPQGYLYKNISMFIDKGHKIGLTGKNGAGKSTLLRLISGEISPTEGNIVRAKDLNIGYLTQDIIIQKNISVRSYIEKSNQHITELQARLEAVNNSLVTRTDYESESYMNLINEITEINDQLTVLEAHQFAEKIESVLKGLGFKTEEFDNDLGEFSGGWQMRAELAKLLVNNPDLLLIDEPTNHLDIVSIQWLEDYLKNYKGGLVLISHDKRFLDNVTNRTVEVANQRLYDYKCNYSKYLVLHAEEIERAIQTKKNQDREIERTQALINKYRAKANKAAFAQSLIKKLDKMDVIEVDSIDRAAFNVNFPVSQASGKIVMELKKLSKSFGSKVIFKEIDLLLARNEKIALLGPNGVGKSTLLKVINKEIDFQGSVDFGHNVKIGYFAQDSAEQLDPNKTVFQIIDDIAEGDKRKDIRATLGAFLFGGDDIDKKVSVLSGGERTRLAICKLLFYDFNFLILDEPTNHLDLNSKEILKDALKAYEGTLLLVSHDRDFLDGLSNKIWEIKDYELKTHLFGVNEFLERIGNNTYDNLNKELIKDKHKSNKSSINQKISIDNKTNQKEIKKLETKIKNSENKITKLESELVNKQSLLEQVNFEDTSMYQKALEAYEQAELNLNNEIENWEELELKLEELNKT